MFVKILSARADQKEENDAFFSLNGRARGMDWIGSDQA